MRKIILSVMMTVLMATSAMADDKVVSADTLPQSSQSFIAANFDGATVTYVEKDFDSYDVQLSNGIEIDFKRNGEWAQASIFFSNASIASSAFLRSSSSNSFSLPCSTWNINIF